MIYTPEDKAAAMNLFRIHVLSEMDRTYAKFKEDKATQIDVRRCMIAWEALVLPDAIEAVAGTVSAEPLHRWISIFIHKATGMDVATHLYGLSQKFKTTR